MSSTHPFTRRPSLAVEVTSTTGTAPLRFVSTHAAGRVRVELEDGSAQLYDARELFAALYDVSDVVTVSDVAGVEHTDGAAR